MNKQLEKNYLKSKNMLKGFRRRESMYELKLDDDL